MDNQQRGGTILGLILGVLVGLGIALGVAVYVTKVPVPFSNKEAPRGTLTPNNGANPNWDPNSPLYGSAPKPTAPAAVNTEPSVPSGEKSLDPIAAPPATTADPLGDLVAAQIRSSEAKSTATASAAAVPDGFHYFVQAGAFRSQAEAEGQRAKLAIQGWEARITEREQNGRPLFRVRLGPFSTRAEAEQHKLKLDNAGIDSALIRAKS